MGCDSRDLAGKSHWNSRLAVLTIEIDQRTFPSINDVWSKSRMRRLLKPGPCIVR
jgi:hypothetical protein